MHFKKRPVNLDLLSIRFPIMAIVSILHRISGVLLFLFIPVLLALMQYSLSSPEGFTCFSTCMTSAGGRLLLFFLISSLLYHFLAGIRHFLMDMGYFESKRGGKIAARLTLLCSLLLIAYVGVYLWGL